MDTEQLAAAIAWRQQFCLGWYKMARNLEFDLEMARAAIMRTFWLHGYEGTTLTDLERATSLVRTSLYNTFGNKPAMFIESLLLYHQTVEAEIDAAVGEGGTKALTDVIAGMIEGTHANERPAGCLMVGAAVQCGALGERHLQLVRSYRKMLVGKARDALDRDKATGRLAETFDTKGAGELLGCIVWGALAAQCLGGGSSPTASAVTMLRQTMDGWLET